MNGTPADGYAAPKECAEKRSRNRLSTRRSAGRGMPGKRLRKARSESKSRSSPIATPTLYDRLEPYVPVQPNLYVQLVAVHQCHSNKRRRVGVVHENTASATVPDYRRLEDVK